MYREVYSPFTEAETIWVRSILQSAHIPFIVSNDHFGSLFVGFPIRHCNVKTILVPKDRAAEARDLIEDFLSATRMRSCPYTLLDRLRMVAELLVFGWCVPGRCSISRPRPSS